MKSGVSASEKEGCQYSTLSVSYHVMSYELLINLHALTGNPSKVLSTRLVLYHMKYCLPPKTY